MLSNELDFVGGIVYHRTMKLTKQELELYILLYKLGRITESDDYEFQRLRHAV